MERHRFVFIIIVWNNSYYRKFVIKIINIHFKILIEILSLSIYLGYNMLALDTSNGIDTILVYEYERAWFIATVRPALLTTEDIEESKRIVKKYRFSYYNRLKALFLTPTILLNRENEGQTLIEDCNVVLYFIII